jgi:hypothetical protein
MTTIKHISRVAVLITAIGALLLLAGPASGASSKPAGMSKAEYRALMLRSQALNEKYGLAPSNLEGGDGARNARPDEAAVLRPAAVRRVKSLDQREGGIVHLKGEPREAGTGMTKAESRALMLRSEALNKKYHLGAFAVSPPVVAAEDGFAWSAFIIGAAAALGLVLLAGGAVAGGRRGRGVLLRTRSS